ncbi:hypothetical protein [Aquimonas voraii]|uniref:Uncharacterized protein n=1 Tax=Aquimonas voraii TaxID=265719 RepID=A0A1G7AK62_9GAMM|nr:hypothetical protein [Aquimonas voraii]SDE15172.1 hypothetical protein SAMN04488509_1324 [Aquimonas voraii]
MLNAPTMILASTFSPSMLPREGSSFGVAFERLSLSEIRKALRAGLWASAVGRPEVADHMSRALQMPVPVARRRVQLAADTRLFVLNPRLRTDLWGELDRELDDLQFHCFEVRSVSDGTATNRNVKAPTMNHENFDEIFYLIGNAGERLVPCVITSRKCGERGYHVMPPGKGNDVSSATITLDPRAVVEAVVLRGMSVRCKPDTDERAPPSAISLGKRSAPRYWLRPDLHDWVKGARIAPSTAAFA